MHLLELNRLAAVGKGTQTSSTRMPSRALWNDCPYFELRNGSKDGFAHWDDFLGSYVQAVNVAASATTLADPWAAFTDITTPTVASVVSPTDATGSIALFASTTVLGGVLGLHTAINTSAPIDALSATNRVWWEARLKTSTITTQEITFFAGLLPIAKIATPASTVFATSGSVMAAIDHIGFQKIAAGTTAVKTVHGNGTSTVLDATAATVAADTYTKLGMYWDGAVATFYQDGAALATTVALAATQFPAGASLAFHLAWMNGSSNNDTTLTVDWVKIAFERTATSGT